VDDEKKFKEIVHALVVISDDMSIFYMVHPRARKNLERFGLTKIMDDSDVELLPPLSYLDSLRLWKNASLVLTDSGGLQEETTALGIPCFTIRENTERPITIEEGTNTLVGTSSYEILHAYMKFKNGNVKKGRIPELWDGRSAERIVDKLIKARIRP
jgi:UDP-N-acetylglucosamine 2-epimerase (non-hydrolysing)